MSELFDAPAELLPHVERLMPGLELALKELGTQAPRELAAHPGPPAVPVTLTVLRVVVDPACDLFEALEAVGGRLAELVREPGGARTLGVLRYAVVVRRGLDVSVYRVRLGGASPDPE